MRGCVRVSVHVCVCHGFKRPAFLLSFQLSSVNTVNNLHQESSSELSSLSLSGRIGPLSGRIGPFPWRQHDVTKMARGP